MQPVTDPALISELENAAAARKGKVVTDPLTIGQLEYGIDFSQPIETVRGAIAKLPEDKRSKALDTWADAYVANERKQQGVAGTVDDTARTLARGTFIGPFLDEMNAATAGAAHKLSGGYVGAPYDETLAYNRARDRYVDQNAPALSTAGKITGALVGGGAAVRAGSGSLSIAAGGPLGAMTPAATALGRTGQAAGAGAAFGATAGFGDAEGGLDNRLGGAAKGAVIGGVTGGVLGSGIETVRGVRTALARQGETGAAASLAERLPGTVDDFASSVATGASTHKEWRQLRTFNIVGEEMERAGGNHLVARDAALRRIINEFQVTPKTARAQIRDLTNVHRDSPLLMAEYPAVAESNRTTRLVDAANIDIAQASQIRPTRLQGTIDYLANQGGRASDVTRTAVMDRQAGLGDWMRNRLQQIAPGGGDLAAAEARLDGIRQMARQEYQAAYTGPQNTPRFLAGMQVAVRNAMQRLGGRGGEHAQALRAAIDHFTPAQVVGQPGARGIVTDMQAAQDARAAVRGMIEAARRQGRNDIAAVLQPFYDDVSRAMASASPLWRRANARWGDMSIETRALELGQMFTDKASVAQRQAFREFDRMAPQAQDMVRIGFIQKQLDKLDGLRDTHDVSRVFDKRQFFDAVDRLFGRADAAQVARAVRDAEVANISKQGLGNSATHQRGQIAREMDADLGIVASAESGSLRGVRNWLIEKALGWARDRRNVPMADMATTPMTDVFSVARNVYRMRQAQERVRALANPSAWPAVVSGGVGGLEGEALARRPQ